MTKSNKIRKVTKTELKSIATANLLQCYIDNDKCIFGETEQDLNRNIENFNVAMSEYPDYYGDKFITYMFPVNTEGASDSTENHLIEELSGMAFVKIVINNDSDFSFIEVNNIMTIEGCFYKGRVYDIKNNEDLEELSEIFEEDINEDNFNDFLESLAIPDLVLLYLKSVKVDR